MRDDDAEGRGYASHHVGTPTSKFEEGGGGGEDTAQHSFAPLLAYVFGLDVHGLLFFFTYFYVCAADGA